MEPRPPESNDDLIRFDQKKTRLKILLLPSILFSVCFSNHSRYSCAEYFYGRSLSCLTTSMDWQPILVLSQGRTCLTCSCGTQVAASEQSLIKLCLEKRSGECQKILIRLHERYKMTFQLLHRTDAFCNQAIRTSLEDAMSSKQKNQLFHFDLEIDVSPPIDRPTRLSCTSPVGFDIYISLWQHFCLNSANRSSWIV